ncbi:MAG: CehA/McbA family metallohydrolase, partial [Verrucomicrobiae bacterium]|nr:CehA/McbA family metallohydrolase [Verrucomicrobiae bacterium]
AVRLNPGDKREIKLALEHQVPLPGWISVDSHIHTLTHSGHGDASIDERMLTIAGEGIELAIATDHNHHADYTDASAKMGTQALFRHVIGNEVTTKFGHFNAFPIQPGSPVPDAKLEDWTQLLTAVRQTPGVRVVILNHPRNLHSGFVPMGPTQFDTLTGKHRRAAAFSLLNGMEIVTSAAMQSDPYLPIRDWFALLNRGHRVSGVGSSDTHDVNRYLLGQARTYVAADDSGDRLDLNEVWKSYEDGRLLVSMGLIAQIRVGEADMPGSLVTPSGNETEIEVTVLGPSWTRADRVELYANGELIQSADIAPTEGKVEKARQVWRIPTPKHDAWLVAVATGPGVTEPFCETPRPYQPASPEFYPGVIGVTNPIWLDGDHDGNFTAPLQQASALIREHGADPSKLIRALADYDEVVAVQAAALCVDAGFKGSINFEGAPAFVRRGFEAVMNPAAP